MAAGALRRLARRVRLTTTFAHWAAAGPISAAFRTISSSIQNHPPSDGGLPAAVPVGEYLADQIMLPLAIAGQGRYLTLPLTRHSTTHIELIGQFLGIGMKAERQGRDCCLVSVGS